MLNMNQYQIAYYCIVLYLKPYFSSFFRLVENLTPHEFALINLIEQMNLGDIVIFIVVRFLIVGT